MTINIDISQLEDEILNSLNNIILVSYGSDVYKEVEKEVRRIVTVLEKKHLINERKPIKWNLALYFNNE
jgi:hypothetical protein